MGGLRSSNANSIPTKYLHSGKLVDDRHLGFKPEKEKPGLDTIATHSSWLEYLIIFEKPFFNQRKLTIFFIEYPLDAQLICFHMQNYPANIRMGIINDARLN